MRILLALSLVTAACSDGDPPPPEPHEIVACDHIWEQNGYTDCEGACVDASTALGAQGPSCMGTTSNGAVSCQKTFEYQDIVGCCISSAPKVLFAECD